MQMEKVNQYQQSLELSNQMNQSPEFIKLQRKTTPDQIEDGESIEINLNIDQNSDGRIQEEQVQQPTIDPSLEKQLYQHFLYKVLGILFVMWSIVCIIVIIIIASDSLQQFMQDNYFLFYISIALLIIIAVILYCYHQVAKRSPYNYYMLFGFTLFIAYIFGYLCAEVSTTSLIIAAGLSTLLIVSLFVYALTTKTDVTYKACSLGYSFIAIFFIVICLLTFRDKIVDVVVSLIFIGALSFFLVYDLQKLKGKFHKSYEIDDYIIAALDLFIDMVLIFKFALSAIQNN